MVDAGARSLQDLAGMALAGLRRRGTRDNEDRCETTVRRGNGKELQIICHGVDLPSSVPSEIAAPDRIAMERPFIGAYRLIVRVPLVVFDIYWTPGQPLRIMNFSRGDWEDDLVSAS